MGRFYVYELIDPRTEQVFYVGKGQKSRINHHESEARRKVRSRKCNMIRSIWADGLEVTKRKVAWFDDEDFAYEAERDLIAAHGLKSLANNRAGGRGSASLPDGPSIIEDRLSVKRAATIIMSVAERPSIMDDRDTGLNWTGMLQQWRQRVTDIAQRRGDAWVNEIARPIGLEFQPVSFPKEVGNSNLIDA